ncbi:MAG: glycosyl transferase [Muribaculaceae bacterium]|nr:glycosyl transferase [Muribaculaceae bacterium]
MNKTIHYCWFGSGSLPGKAEKCIKSWKRYLPDHEIVRWDESNFDVNIIPYTKQAYEAGKYAFVSDYARYWVLYHYGGLYFDTDVEIIRNIDDILTDGPFMGCETPYTPDGSDKDAPWVNPGLGLGLDKGDRVAEEILNHYAGMHYVSPDRKAATENVVSITTKALIERGLRNSPDIQTIGGIKIYPSDYFCPISTEDGKLHITPNTRSIHWFDQSWQSPLRKYGRKLLLALGGVRVKNVIKRILYR